jgi:MFS family permease
MSMGRVGAVIGPLLAGWLIASGFDRPVYFSVLAIPVLLAVVCVFCVRELA